MVKSERAFLSGFCVDTLPSPNHGARTQGAEVSLLILHYTGMLSADAALSWLRNSNSQVSAHYFIFEDGRIVQLVDESRRAWHAGVSSWRHITDINSYSIGIEIANPGHEFGYRPFPQVQIEAVIALCRDILKRWPIAPRDVLAHSDVAPLRKEDPGELFPWNELHAAGVGHFIAPAPIEAGAYLRLGDEGEEVLRLQTSLCSYGYSAPLSGAYCTVTTAVVRAFQRHFRPCLVDGIADESTRKTLSGLIAALP